MLRGKTCLLHEMMVNGHKHFVHGIEVKHGQFSGFRLRVPPGLFLQNLTSHIDTVTTGRTPVSSNKRVAVCSAKNRTVRIDKAAAVNEKGACFPIRTPAGNLNSFLQHFGLA